MPFIYDDFEWKYVDEEEQYDKSLYVVIRKLQITLNTGPKILENSQFTEDEIRRHFRKFGDIEQIDILSSNEAYVTFVRDRDAYLTQLQQDYDIQIKRQRAFRIRPADTWLQPTNVSNEPVDAVQTSEIFNLNEDCLRYLFSFLDLDSLVNLSEVCKLFHSILHQHFFPRFQHFTVDNSGKNVQMPISKIRRTLHCIGAHITDLKYACNINNDVQTMTRFVRILAQFIGSNLRRAQFWNSLICMGNQILILKPIFRNLESLEIHDTLPDYFDDTDTIQDYYDDTETIYGIFNDTDFEEICPNLIELKLKINMRLRKCCCKPWRRLQHLSVLSNKCLNTMDFVEFVELNPQLRVIEFEAVHSEVRLREVGTHLSLLEKLTMDSIDFEMPWELFYISNLTHLTEINLINLNYEHLCESFDCLSIFERLRKIDFHAIIPLEEVDDENDYEQSLVNMIKELPHLEEFALRSVLISENTLIELLKLAKQLKTIHTHRCRLRFSDLLIFDIVSILKYVRPNKKLIFNLDPADFAKISVTRNDDVKQYLSISSKCQHLRF